MKLGISSVKKNLYLQCCIFVYRKQCILSESRFDFLKDLVKSLPDVSGPDDEVPMSPETSIPGTNSSSTATTCPVVTQHSEPVG